MAVVKALTLAVRLTQEVFEDHLSKRDENDLEGDLKFNYAPDVVLLTCTDVLRGHEGVRQSHKVLLELYRMRVLRCRNKLLDGKFAFLEWRASRAALKCGKGADSFVIRDGKICFQSIHYKVHPVSRSEGNSNGLHEPRRDARCHLPSSALGSAVALAARERGKGNGMRQLRRIIVGYDLGVGGEVALSSAAVLAKRCNAALRLVHVVEPLDSYQRISHPLTSPYPVEEIAQKIGARLKALMTGAELAGLNAEYEVRTGKPFVELIVAQRAWLADLIVVGGASQPEEPFPVSTSERLMRKADVPVMIAKSRLSVEAKTFLVATDFSAGARQAAEEALILAENFHGRVVFLHVFDQPSYVVNYVHELGVSLPIAPPTPEQLEPEWEAFLSGLPLEKVDWEKSSTEGKAATAIVGQAEHVKADVIVMGTHGRSGLPYILLGSVAEKVARTASCPVLTIRPEPFQLAGI